MSGRLLPVADQNFVDEAIGLATCERDDRFVLAGGFRALPAAGMEKSANENVKAPDDLSEPAIPYRGRYSKDSMADPARVSYFQRLMSHYDLRKVANGVRRSATINKVVPDFGTYTRWAANQSLAAERSFSKKSWISPASRAVVKA